ncbi:TIGR00366 family protein [Corynebacterium glutamicum]|uniref:TIGR00366 family protein n=1 Tax=Corynebacterium glutamicum TaxID=1718 RepID=UPI000A5FF513|nr:TIGR00366 family protein [Corynebacterium glutamicum]
MSLHPEAEHFVELTSKAPDLDTRPPAENRVASEATRHLMGEKTPVAYVHDVLIKGVPVRIYSPHPNDGPLPVFIYFHGGGWVLGDLESVDSTVRDIAVASGALCISVDYRRAPEHPFPAALDDCQVVTEAVLNGELASANQQLVTVGGDSAGGNIAAVIAQQLRDQITHQVLVYPVMDVILLVICSIITTGFALLMHPKSKDKTETISGEFLAEIQAGSEKISIPRSTPAEKANASRWIMYFAGGIGLLYSVFSLWTGGVTGLTLNSFNFLFLSLGMVLTANYGPEYYAKLVREGIQGTWGFILQFPFYAGIFGLISFTGLGVVISGFFTSISTATTWPAFAFLYSGLLNLAVPSGGSKFIIEAPYIIPTTVDFGADMGLVLQAYQMGDGATNLLIPFFALPYLANFKIKFSQVVGYTVPPVLVVIAVICIYLFLRASII